MSAPDPECVRAGMVCVHPSRREGWGAEGSFLGGGIPQRDAPTGPPRWVPAAEVHDSGTPDRPTWVGWWCPPGDPRGVRVTILHPDSVGVPPCPGCVREVQEM